MFSIAEHLQPQGYPDRSNQFLAAVRSPLSPKGEYNGLRGENRDPFKGRQASASNPVMWLWLAGLYEALPHMLPATRYPATSWPTIPRSYSTALQPVHTGGRPGSDCGLDNEPGFRTVLL